MTAEITVLPVTPERWDDLTQLFGPNGCYGCWCMWYRLTSREFKQAGKDGRREGMRTLVQTGVQPGLIAYVDGVPAGWVTIAPRSTYVRLETSRTLKPVDDAPVWSIPCFFVHRDFRRQGLSEALLRGAVAHGRANSAAIVEAYPYDQVEKASAASIFMGVTSTFRRVGFVEVARRAENHPVMRLTL